MATPQRTFSMKLLIDKKTNMVLFAEARKDVIDFLFGLLTIPVGSIIKLLTTESMVGCIGNLYKSIETIDECYIVSNEAVRSSLLNPAGAAKVTHFLTESSSTASAAKNYYTCLSDVHSNYSDYFTDMRGIECPDCSDEMTTEISYLSPNSESVVDAAEQPRRDGFVRGRVTYSVMDDLTVTPMPTVSSIRMLKKFHVTDVGSLEERKVELGMKEVFSSVFCQDLKKIFSTCAIIRHRLVESIAAVKYGSYGRVHQEEAGIEGISSAVFSYLNMFLLVVFMLYVSMDLC